LLLLGCAKRGNLRDGKAIHSAIIALNAQQPAPSDAAAEAERCLQKIRFDVPMRPQGRPKGVIELRPRRKRQPRNSAAAVAAFEAAPVPKSILSSGRAARPRRSTGQPPEVIVRTLRG
jgi:hypothetical protein